MRRSVNGFFVPPRNLFSIDCNTMFSALEHRPRQNGAKELSFRRFDRSILNSMNVIVITRRIRERIMRAPRFPLVAEAIPAILRIAFGAAAPPGAFFRYEYR
jgi:hypothetical protein